MKTSRIRSAAKIATVAGIAGAIALGFTSPADAATGTTYGNPEAAAKYWRYQKYDDCVIMSSADVIGQVTGHEPDEQSIIRKAQSTPSVEHPGSIYTKPADIKDPNSGMGTSVGDIPTLLAQYKVNSVMTDKSHSAKTGIASGIEGIEQELSGGHAVIVSLNAELIWHMPIQEKDANGNPRADHAVVVTGVDTANNMVHLNDSGTSGGRNEQIPLELFLRAWNTSNELMIATA